MANRVVSVQLVADVGQYQSQMTKAATLTKGVGDTATRTGTQAQRGFDMAGRGATLLAGALAGGVALGLKNVVDAASNAEQSIGGVNAVFKNYGRTVIASSQEADRALGLSANSYRELATVIGSQMKNAGVPLDELAGKTEGIIGIGADLAAQFGGSTQQAVEALSSAFRGELDPIERYGISLTAAAVGAKAVDMGLAESATSLDQNAKAMATLALITEQSADAQGAFAREADTAAGQAARSAAQWENLKVEIGNELLPVWSELLDVLGDGVIPMLGGVVSIVSGAVDAFGDLPGPVQAGVVALASVAALKGPVGSAMDTIALKSLYARDAMTGASIGMGKLKGAGAGLMGFFGGPWGLAFAGAAAGVTLLSSVLGDSGDDTDNAAASAENLTRALEETSGAIDSTVRAAAAQDLQESGLLEWAETLGVRSSVMTDALLGVPGALDQVTSAFNRYAQANTTWISDESGYSAEILDDQGNAAMRAMEQFTGLAGVTEETAAKQRQLAEATQQTTDSTGAALDPVAAYAAELEGAAEAANAAKKQTDAFKLSLDILTGATVTMIEIESAFQAAVDDAEGALESMNGTVLDGAGDLNLQSEAGRKAADVLLGVRDSGNQLIAQMIQQGRSSDEVRAKDAELRGSFVATAQQMGISRADAERLTDQILGIPTERETKIDADVTQARANVAATQRDIDGMRGKTVTVTVVSDRKALALYAAQNGMQTVGGYASGGYTGPGRKHDVAGVVHAGEVVWSQDDVAAHGGPRRVDSMRRARPGYADGGIVVKIDNAGLRSGIQSLTNAMEGSLRPAEPVGGGSSSGLLPIMAAARQYVMETYGIRNIGGYANRNIAGTNVKSDHAMGKAIDVMTSNRQLGWAVANDLAYGAAKRRFNIENVIWQQSISSNGGPFRRMADRGSITQNHYDHVHADTYDQGGILRHGQLGINLSGSPERVLNPRETAAYEAGVRAREFSGGGGGGGSAVTVTAPVVHVTLDGQELRHTARVEAGQVVSEREAYINQRARSWS